MTLRFAVAIAVCSLPATVSAEGHSEDVEALFNALQMPQMIEVMRDEGIAYGDQIAKDFFPAPPNADWAGQVEALYDLDYMRGEVLAGLEASLSQSEVRDIIAFVDTDLGQEIATLEVEARRARLDEDVEAAADDHALLSAMDETPRFLAIQEYVETFDLVETNVVSALNFNYAFLQGLAAGGALPNGMTEDMVLTQVWDQEPEIRSNTTKWIYSFLLMAYQPLSDEDLATYIEFAKTDAGQALNRALIGSFDPLYTDISGAIGRAAADVMTVQDL